MVSKRLTFISFVLMAMMVSIALMPAVSTAAERIAENDSDGSSTVDPSLIVAAGTTADFSSDVTYGIGSLTVNFLDLSVNAASWSWNFGDGTTSTEQNPSHVYSVPGTYTVTLTVADLVGSDAETKTAYIKVAEA